MDSYDRHPKLAIEVERQPSALQMRALEVQAMTIGRLSWDVTSPRTGEVLRVRRLASGHGDAAQEWERFTRALGRVARGQSAKAAGWEESEHPRHPAGSSQGGEFAPKSGGGSGSISSVLANVREAAEVFAGAVQRGGAEKEPIPSGPQAFPRSRDIEAMARDGLPTPYGFSEKTRTIQKARKKKTL